MKSKRIAAAMAAIALIGSISAAELSPLALTSPLTASAEETAQAKTKHISLYSVSDLEKYLGFKGGKELVIPETVTIDGTEYIIDDINGEAIYRSGVESVTIPKTIGTVSRSNFTNCTFLKNVILSDGITAIDYGAFSLCQSLESITIPDSVTSIGDSAFSDCKNLKSLEIPDSVTHVGKLAFFGCSGLESLKLPSGITKIEERTFAYCGVKELIIPEGVTEIDSSAFEINNIESIKLPSSLEKISGEFDLFAGCHNIKSIEFSDTPVEMECPVINLYYCRDLEYVKLPIGIKELPHCCFMSLSKLKTVILPEGLEKIDSEAFMGCDSLESLSLPKSVTEIGDLAFEDCGLKELTILNPELSLDFSKSSFDELETVYGYAGSTAQEFAEKNSLEFIEIKEDDADSGDKSETSKESKTRHMTLTSVSDLEKYLGFKGGKELVIPETVTVDGTEYIIDDIDGEAIYRSGVESVTIPKTIGTVSRFNFTNCTFLKNIILSDGITAIDYEAFSLCKSLESITIPDSVTSIGDSAFSDCKNLKSLEIPDSVTHIGESAFSGCSGLESLKLPSGITKIEERTFAYCGVKELIIPEGVTEIDSSAFGINNIESIKLPSSLEKISGEFDLFAGCQKIKSIEFSDTPVEIDCEHFTFNSLHDLEYLKLPVGIKETPFLGFMNLTHLKTVILPEGLETIGDLAFSDCTSLESLTIPKSVTEIGDHAFEGCGLKELTILNPELSLDFSKSSFDELETVYGYAGSAAQELAVKNNAKFIAISQDENTGAVNIKGDANCDGSINLADTVMIMQALANPDKYGINGTDASHITLQGTKNADVIGNDGMTNNDALSVQKFKLDLIASLPEIE